MNLLNRLLSKRKKYSSSNEQIKVSYPMEIVQQLCTVKENKIIFDVGAYIGNYSTALHDHFPEAEIHAFEPFKDSFKALENNVKKFEKIKTYNLAISNYSGVAKLNINNFTETNSLLESECTESKIDELIKTNNIQQVKVLTIDKFCKLNNIISIDFLKIDIQGNSLKALEGCEALLKEGNIQVIQVEVEFIKIYKDQHLYHHVASYLESFEYEFYSIFNLHYEINERLSWGDAIFVKKTK